MESVKIDVEEGNIGRHIGCTKTLLDFNSVSRYISFTPAPDDIFFQCPYDSSHIILQYRFGRHLTRCRKNHQLKLQGKGLTTRLVSCVWSSFHMIPELELPVHLHQCSEKHKAPVDGKDVKLKHTPKIIHHTELDVALSEENWEHNCTATYDPKPHLKLRGIVRQPTGLTKGEKKRFRALRKELLDQTSESCLDNHEKPSKPGYVVRQPKKVSFMDIPPLEDSHLQDNYPLIIAKTPLDFMEPIEEFCKEFAKLKLA